MASNPLNLCSHIGTLGKNGLRTTVHASSERWRLQPLKDRQWRRSDDASGGDSDGAITRGWNVEPWRSGTAGWRPAWRLRWCTSDSRTDGGRALCNSQSSAQPTRHLCYTPHFTSIRVRPTLLPTYDIGFLILHSTLFVPRKSAVFLAA